MIKNYLYTIGKYLTPSQKDEVLKEIEANLYDYLEENFGKRDYTNAEIESALRAMGHPKEVAQAYQTSPRALIGAVYIDTYWLVVKIALIGTSIGITFANLIHISPGTSSLQLFLSLLSKLYASALSSFGIVTLIFALIQHYSPQQNSLPSDTWKISDLDNAPEAHQKVKLFDLIVETVFICFGLVVLNTALPVFSFELNGTQVLPIVNKTFFAPYVVMLTLVLGASLLLNIYLLIYRKWQTTTRIIAIAVDLLGVGIITKMALSPEIWNFTALTDVLGKNAKVDTWFSLTINISLAVLIIISAFSIFGQIKAILRK